MEPLARQLRNQLENAIIAARKAAEKGAVAALDRFAVAQPEPFSHMAPAERALRNRLRARARALGDPLEGKRQTIAHLTREVAYEHWHRMLFARFLAENALLIHPDGVPVTLAECEELAREEGAPNGWALAERYAARMLPQIFRPDDPVLQVPLAPEDEQALERLLDGISPDVFAADDSLGWCYQFWQTEEKKRVNDSGEKITGETLPAVTQLFTEHYMVQFLLDNTLGAWWAGKNLTAEDAENAETEEELRRKLALPGADWDYLRFVREEDASAGPQSSNPIPNSEPRTPNTEHPTPTFPWRPAAGTFPGWPKAAKDVKVLDPCCGSGHFLVAALHILVPMRMREEALSARDACDAVLRDNLFGLEIDPRCTQIAAFALAFAAWRYPDAGGFRPLPGLQIACSGIGPQATEEQWLKLAEQSGIRMPALGREPIRNGLLNLHQLFSQAPTLGSLINPAELPADLIAADYETLQPYLSAIMSAEKADDETREQAIAAAGMVKAAALLAGEYTLVITNVPYLGRNRQNDLLKAHLEEHYSEGKADLATAFVQRCLDFCSQDGTTGLVTPQIWLFLTSYRKLRELLLKCREWNLVARLGPGAFEAIGGHVVNVALPILSWPRPTAGHRMAGVDVCKANRAEDKASLLRGTPAAISVMAQAGQLDNPDARVLFEDRVAADLLSAYAESYWGIGSGDIPRFMCKMWEVRIAYPWQYLHTTFAETAPYTGKNEVVWFINGADAAHLPQHEQRLRQSNRWTRGSEGWTNDGIAIHLMSGLSASLYTGEIFQNGVAVIIANDQRHRAAIWCYCSSPDFRSAVRQLDQKLSVTNYTLLKVPFDLARWQKVAAEKYPDGLPEPESDDPTQWLFHGRPEESSAPLQVAVARLLGYRWPAELDEKMRLSKRARALVKRCNELAGFVDNDGVVCLPSVGGERPGADRVRTLLAAAFGAEWSPAKEAELLAGVGYEGRTLEEWLRDAFFDQHSRLFHHRPFVWHVWDGRKDGFAALVNYHRLDRRLLERLAFSYVNDWTRRQEGEVRSGVGGSEARLAAAQELQRKLALILEGEPPYDIFVRWKPLEQQPIGWEPDLNDGVRLNIRPFMQADILRKTPSINWRKDRGKEPERPREQYPWFWGWDQRTTDFAGGATFDGNRWNDCHYTSKAKQAAREASKNPEATSEGTRRQ